MSIPSSIPCLTLLIESDQELSHSCLWLVKPKSKKDVARTCANNISAPNLKERKKLVQSLQSIIPSMTRQTRSSLDTTKSDKLDLIYEALKSISKLMVCKRQHQKYSDEIYTKWSKEFESLEESRFESARQKIREEIGVDDGERFICRGKTNGLRCSNWIRSKDRDRINDIIAEITKTQNSSAATRDNIILMARLSMCQRYHWDQAAEKAEDWFKKIQKLYPPAHTVQEQPSTPTTTRTATLDSETPETVLSSGWSRPGSATLSTPATSPTRQRRYGNSATPSDSPLQAKNKAPPKTAFSPEQPQAANTSPEPRLTQFEPYSPKNGACILKDLCTLVKRTNTPQEKEDGYVYGFQRDSEAGELIKVGYSRREVKERIRELETKCDQKVTVVFQEKVPHAKKVEGLIHKTLHRERRKERLVEGRCNSGRGCPHVHREWFVVTEERFRDVARAWIRWIRTEPYDEKGGLKPNWADHIDKVFNANLDPRGNPWHKWITYDVSGEDPTVEAVKENVEEDTKEDVKEDVKDIPNIKEEPKIIITEKEITDLSRLSRELMETITKLNEQSLGERPLTEVIQDVPFSPADPFTVVPVAA